MNNLHIDIIGQGQPLVLIPGWGWNKAVWEPLIPFFKNRFQLYLVDLSRFRSEFRSDEYTLEKIVPQIVNIIPEESYWLGWSMGGLFVLWAAIHFPNRVGKFITVTSSPRFVKDVNWPGIDVSLLTKFSDLLINDIEKTLRDFKELQLRGSFNKNELMPHVQSHFDSSSISPEVLLAGLKLLSETDLRSALSKISCPNLHIFGQLDRIVSADLIYPFSLLLPESQFQIITRSGHMPFLSHTTEFVNLVNEFLY